jgi:ribose-phosphate pyrophosphokinase
VNALSIESSKSLMLFSGRAYPELAEEVGKYLDVTVTPQSAYDFANGEIFVRFEESVRGSDAFLVQSCGAPINTWVMETLIMIDALKRASAKRITVVLPFYPYARQDKKHRGREPISARLISDLLKTAGASRLMTVDLHTDQIQGFFDGPVDHLWAQPLLTEYIAGKYSGDDLTVSPPTPAGCGRPNAGPTGSGAHRSPSSTRPGTRCSPTRSSPIAWSVMWTAGPASSWTT